MHGPVYLWKRAPFIRYIFFLAVGILLQHQHQFLITYLWCALFIAVVFSTCYSLLPLSLKFRWSGVNGIFILTGIAIAGAILTWKNDVRNDRNWIGHETGTDYFIATIQEPIEIKTNSLKTIASVQTIRNDHIKRAHKGMIIIYFSKDHPKDDLKYGSILYFSKPLQEIRNSNNPGSFDYKRYCLFNGITHQVYLGVDEVYLSKEKTRSLFRQFIFNCRTWIVGVLQNYIPGKKEQGLAEALLIGYKEDLDKDLVQSYSNTGVVHVIAISGLHLGLIYGLLLLLTKPLDKKKLRWIRLLFILSFLWAFSILAGAQPSVLRSAVMFSFIATAKLLDRQANIYNSLCLSAFLLLCYNPFWIFDAGFQLSYAAVVSIVAFFKPVYNWVFFSNPLLDQVWKLNAVTISAQLLTLPVSIFHFHQVPVLFLFTNLVAVPLSSLILMGEILLCVLQFYQPAANILGKLLRWLIHAMNSYIERFDHLPFATLGGLSISAFQAILLTGFILTFCFWLLQRSRSLLWWALTFFLFFSLLNSLSIINAEKQNKLIVYNLPRKRGIEIIQGRASWYSGDVLDPASERFHINPARILFRISDTEPVNLPSCLQWKGKKILLIDSSFRMENNYGSTEFDLVIISRHSALSVKSLLKNLRIRAVVLDGTLPRWKALQLKKELAGSAIPVHDVTENGAFAMNLQSLPLARFSGWIGRLKD